MPAIHNFNWANGLANRFGLSSRESRNPIIKSKLTDACFLMENQNNVIITFEDRYLGVKMATATRQPAF